jgi:hypothetical protein
MEQPSSGLGNEGLGNEGAGNEGAVNEGAVNAVRCQSGLDHRSEGVQTTRVFTGGCELECVAIQNFRLRVRSMNG